MENSFELNRELREYQNDKVQYEKELQVIQEGIANDLKNGLGDDIKKVLNGEEVIEIPKKMKIKYSVRHYLNKIFKHF